MPVYLQLIFIAISIIGGIFTSHNLLDIIPIICLVLYTLSILQSKEKNIRLFTVANILGWMIYDFYAKAYVGILFSLFTLISTIIAIIRYDIKKGKRKMEYNIEEITEKNRQRVNDILINEWEATDIIIRGKIIDGTKLEGFLAMKGNEIIGLITYMIENNECEIVSLNSFEENKGIATRLINIVKELAINSNCTRLKLITTNDNIRGIEFYQKRGFVFSNIYINAIDNSRKLKPEIPMFADNGLPIRDEIEFEIKLQ